MELNLSMDGDRLHLASMLTYRFIHDLQSGDDCGKAQVHLMTELTNALDCALGGKMYSVPTEALTAAAGIYAQHGDGP